MLTSKVGQTKLEADFKDKLLKSNGISLKFPRENKACKISFWSCISLNITCLRRKATGQREGMSTWRMTLVLLVWNFIEHSAAIAVHVWKVLSVFRPPGSQVSWLRGQLITLWLGFSKNLWGVVSLTSRSNESRICLFTVLQTIFLPSLFRFGCERTEVN